MPGDSDADMHLYHIAFATHRPEPNESNAESADPSRRIDDQVEALKREGGVLSQRTMRDSSPKATSAPPPPNTGFFDEEYCHGKQTGSPLTTEWTNRKEVLGKRTNQKAVL